jgi:VWFA-related protein
MRNSFQEATDALRLILALAQPGDEYCLIRISGNAKLVVGLTKNSTSVTDCINTSSPSGLTALVDAIALGLKQLALATNPHKALVVVSDGGENSSTISRHGIFEAVKQHDVQLYTVTPPRGRDDSYSLLEASGLTLMRSLSELSGGRSFLVDRARQLPQVVKSLNDALHGQYLLGYYTALGEPRQSRFVSVALTRPEALSHLRLSWRMGYSSLEH